MWSYNDELYHYGVLGMKWGRRRSKNTIEKSQSKGKIARESAREWDEIAKYAREKGKNKKAEKYERYAEEDRADAAKIIQKGKNAEKKINDKINSRFSKKTQSRIDKLSSGQALAQATLLGNYGSAVYNSARAKGESRGKSILKAMANETLNNLTFGQVSRKRNIKL